MAIVRKLTHKVLERDVPHRDVDCTYSVVHDDDGRKYLQLDTYGSTERKMPNKKSQSLRFSPEAIVELKALLRDRF
jgi:hypothetical protein